MSEAYQHAKNTYDAAYTAFEQGDFVHTLELCELAFNLARNLPSDQTERPRLLADVIYVLLLAAEFQIHTQPTHDLTQWDELAEEGERCAYQTGDTALIAQMKGLRGKTTRSTQGYRYAVDLLRDALQLHEKIDNPPGKFAILSELGHLLVHEDLPQGLRVLNEAYALYRDRIQNQAAPSTALRRTFHRVEGFIGIAHLDLNNYGDAEPMIEASIQALQELHMEADLLRMLNFRAQYAMCIGNFDLAEETLKTVLLIHERDGKSTAWWAYNLGLLGKVYLEWERIADAANALIPAWQQMKATINADLTPLVNNYFVELLIHPGYVNRNLDAAESQLIQTIAVTRHYGAFRGLITALSLRAMIAYEQQRLAEAVEFSTEAVELLQRFGILPVVRAEEVYYTHHLVLSAVGDADGAQQALQHARKILLEKARTLKNPDLKRGMLQRIPISQLIVQSAGITENDLLQ